jgi:hypothetical protein
VLLSYRIENLELERTTALSATDELRAGQLSSSVQAMSPLSAVDVLCFSEKAIACPETRPNICRYQQVLRTN